MLVVETNRVVTDESFFGQRVARALLKRFNVSCRNLYHCESNFVFVQLHVGKAEQYFFGCGERGIVVNCLGDSILAVFCCWCGARSRNIEQRAKGKLMYSRGCMKKVGSEALYIAVK